MSGVISDKIKFFLPRGSPGKEKLCIPCCQNLCILIYENLCSCNYRLQFQVTELYKGDFIGKVTDSDCIEAEARMTGLTNWIDHTRIIPKINFGPEEESKIIIKDEFNLTYFISKNIRMDLCEVCGFEFDRNESILTNNSQIKFVCGEPSSRLELYKNVTAFLKLLSLFTEDIPTLTQLNFVFSNGRTIEHLSTRRSKSKDDLSSFPMFTHKDICFKIVVENFYNNRDKFVRVIDLLNASIKNPTAEISFLNITTAFEVFHQVFLEENHNEIRNKLSEELLQKGIINRNSKKWDQILRYYHIFKMIEGTDFFKRNILHPDKTLSLIRDSRNYYTHYTITNKEIWSPNKLIFANKELRQILKGVIFKELQLPDSLINKKLNYLVDGFYINYEENDYSLRYLQQ